MDSSTVLSGVLEGGAEHVSMDPNTIFLGVLKGVRLRVFHRDCNM